MTVELWCKFVDIKFRFKKFIYLCENKFEYHKKVFKLIQLKKIKYLFPKKSTVKF